MLTRLGTTQYSGIFLAIFVCGASVSSAGCGGRCSGERCEDAVVFEPTLLPREVELLFVVGQFGVDVGRTRAFGGPASRLGPRAGYRRPG